MSNSTSICSGDNLLVSRVMKALCHACSYLRGIFTVSCPVVLVALIIALQHAALRATGDSLCVRVRIEIDQELTLERQGFEARMNISNGGPVDLDSLNVAVNFMDENNNAVVATSEPT